MAENYSEEIKRYNEIVQKWCKNKQLFDNEEQTLSLEKKRYELLYSQIHLILAPQKKEKSELEIQQYIKDIFRYDLPICESKVARFKDAIAKYEKAKDKDNVELCYQYLQEWIDLYEKNYALLAFRSFEHFATFMEWEKKEKVWLPSLDPHNDGGYTGVNKPFFYYFNRMALKKDIKFISKQMFTGAGKCVVPETIVMTPQGNKMLKDIEVGDFVYSMKDNELCKRRVLNKWYSRKKQVKLTVKSGESVTVSPEHRMFTQRGYIPASEITYDDFLYEFKNDFLWQQILKIECFDEEVDMVDIEVEETHNFIANHLVSHNSYSNQFAFAWLLGIDKENDILDVLGNPTLVTMNAKGVVGIMTDPRFAKVFPEYQRCFDECPDPRNIADYVFSVCRIKEGELTVNGSSKPLNLKIISKETSIDGVRVRFLFLDDVCRSKDANNLTMHEKDISMFWNSWWKRNYGTDNFYIVISGTAYSVNDIMSHLISYYSQGKMIRTKEFKYAYSSVDGKSVFIKIPKIDEELSRSTYPQKFPYEEAIKIKERDYASFMAMEQQQPQNPATSPLCWDKIPTYEEIPTGLSEYAYAVLDPARTGKNYVSMGIHRVKKELNKYNVEIERHYLVDCVFELKTMDLLYDKICDKIIKHHITKLHIENNTDTSLGALIEKMLMERGATFCDISESFSTENKEEKMREIVYNAEGYFKNNMCYPAMKLFAPSSEMGKFMLYLTSYDYYKQLEFDDSIDEECMYIERFVEKRQNTASVKLLYV